MTLTRRAIHCGIGGLLGVALVSCRHREQAAELVVPVQAAPAVRGNIRVLVTADGLLYPRDQATIMPKISAPVRRFHVNRGDHVKEGQLLAELENRDLIAAAGATKGQYAQAEANYRSIASAAVPEQVAKAQADVDAARETLEAAKKLLDSRGQLFKEGALARKQVDEAQVSYAQAKAQFETADQHLRALQTVGKEEQIKAAAGQLETAKGQYESAQAQVAYSEVRSPINGVVTDRPLYAGEMANAGMPLVTVMDMSVVVARLNVAQDRVKEVEVGDEATMMPTDGGEAVHGKVTVVSPAVDPNSTTVQVWVQAKNPGERFRAGTSVHVSIVAATLQGAVLIPAAAVLPSDDGGTKVMIVDDKNVAHERKVEIGARERDVVQAKAGLRPGEEVVTVGGLGLEDNAKVKVERPDERQPAEEDKGRKQGKK